jgi:hypothetical protein
MLTVDSSNLLPLCWSLLIEWCQWRNEWTIRRSVIGYVWKSAHTNVDVRVARKSYAEKFGSRSLANWFHPMTNALHQCSLRYSLEVLSYDQLSSNNIDSGVHLSHRNESIASTTIIIESRMHQTSAVDALTCGMRLWGRSERWRVWTGKFSIVAVMQTERCEIRIVNILKSIWEARRIW